MITSSFNPTPQRFKSVIDKLPRAVNFGVYLAFALDDPPQGPFKRPWRNGRSGRSTVRWSLQSRTSGTVRPHTLLFGHADKNWCRFRIDRSPGKFFRRKFTPTPQAMETIDSYSRIGADRFKVFGVALPFKRSSFISIGFSSFSRAKERARKECRLPFSRSKQTVTQPLHPATMIFLYFSIIARISCIGLPLPIIMIMPPEKMPLMPGP